MSDSLLLQYVDNVLSIREAHCVVCLRTSADRRLVEPRYLTLFSKAADLPELCRVSYHRVCHICERLAAAAYRFHVAASTAAQMQAAAALLMGYTRLQTRNTYLKVFRGEPLPKGAAHNGNGKLSAAAAGEARLRAHRAASQLLQTEVLLVSSPSTAAPTESSFPGEGECSDLYVVPDATPRQRQRPRTRLGDATAVADTDGGLTGAPDIEMESIIIFDDDEPAAPTTLSDPLTTQPDPLTTLPDPQTSQLVPIDQMLDSITDGKMSLLDGNAVLERNAEEDYILHPIIFNNGIMTVPSLNAHISAGRLVTDQNQVLEPKLALQSGANIDFINEPGRVTDLLQMLAEGGNNVNLVNSTGNLVNSTGNLVNSTGNLVNSTGNLVNSTGILVKSTGNVVNSIGNLVNSTGNVINSTGNLVYSSVHTVNSVNAVHKLDQVTQNTKVSSPFVINCGNIQANNSVVHQNSAVNTIVKGNAVDRKVRAKGRDERSPAVSTEFDSGPRLDIDWEAKIPMDLISFVDKNDGSCKRARPSLPPPLAPAAGALSLAPRGQGAPVLGVISAVTSLRQDDVIDLC